jgi:hypothetical protein
MKFLFFPICAFFLLCHPSYAQDQRLCDAIGMPCVVIEQFTPNERYQPLAYTYQTQAAGSEAREAPFDPTHGLWLSTFLPHPWYGATPKSAGPFLMNITGGTEYNTIEVFKLNRDDLRFEKIWDGYIQPQIATMAAPGEPNHVKVTFAIAAPSVDDLPVVRNTAPAEFLFLNVLHGGGWWNELQLSPSAIAGDGFGQSLEARLTEQSVPYELTQDGLVLKGRLNNDQVRGALFRQGIRRAPFALQSNAQYSGNGRLVFERLRPQHPIATFAQQNVPVDLSAVSDGALGRAGVLLAQLRASDVKMDEGVLADSERSIMSQWVPQIDSWRYGSCAQEDDKTKLLLHSRQLSNVWQRIEQVSDDLTPGWEKFLSAEAAQQFDSLHSYFSNEVAPILLIDPCELLQVELMAERLARVENVAMAMADAIEAIYAGQADAARARAEAIAAAREQIPTYTNPAERESLAAWRALSEAYAGTDPRKTARNGSIDLASYFLKDTSYHFSRTEDYALCTLSIAPERDLDEMVLLNDDGCNGTFIKYDGADIQSQFAEQQSLAELIFPWLDPQKTIDAITLIKSSNNVFVDLLVNAVNIDGWFYGILQIAESQRAVMEANFVYRQLPYVFSTTTVTTNTFGDERVGPTRTFNFTADDFSFSVVTAGRTARYTVSRDQEDRFMSLTAEFVPPLRAPGALQFLNGQTELGEIEIFARTDEWFAPLADQSVKLNGARIPDGQMILVARFLQDTFETMAHHLVMGQNLGAITMQTP